MELILSVVFLLVLCLIAPFFGADSRPRDERDRRGWMPGPRGSR